MKKRNHYSHNILFKYLNIRSSHLVLNGLLFVTPVTRKISQTGIPGQLIWAANLHTALMEVGGIPEVCKRWEPSWRSRLDQKQRKPAFKFSFYLMTDNVLYCAGKTY